MNEPAKANDFDCTNECSSILGGALASGEMPNEFDDNWYTTKAIK